MQSQDFSLSFANAELINSTEAANMLEGNTTGEAAPVVDPITPQQGTGAVPVEQLYEVKVNGQTIKVPLAELTGGYSRQQDYTKKTSDIAEYRRQIDAEVQQHRDQIEQVKQFFADPRVQQALAGLRAGVTDPNQPLTAATAQQLYQSQAQAQEALMQQRLQQMSQDLEVKALAHSYSQEISSTIAQLKAKHPVLEDIDGFEDVLRQKVAAQQPQSLDEAKRIFGEIAQQVATKLESRFQTQQKQAAIAQTKLTKGGIEPPGGTVVPMQAEKTFKLGSKDLMQAALADLTGTQQK